MNSSHSSSPKSGSSRGKACPSIQASSSAVSSSNSSERQNNRNGGGSASPFMFDSRKYSGIPLLHPESDNPDGEGSPALVQAKGRVSGRGLTGAFVRLRLAMRRFDDSLAGDILAGLAFAVFAAGVIWGGAFLDYLGVLQ